jgi:hypothetical protein
MYLCLLRFIAKHTKFNRKEIEDWWDGFVYDCPRYTQGSTALHHGANSRGGGKTVHVVFTPSPPPVPYIPVNPRIFNFKAT